MKRVLLVDELWSHRDLQKKHGVDIQWVFVLVGLLSMFVVYKTLPAVMAGDIPTLLVSLLFYFIVMLCVSFFTYAFIMNKRIKKSFVKRIGVTREEHAILQDLIL